MNKLSFVNRYIRLLTYDMEIISSRERKEKTRCQQESAISGTEGLREAVSSGPRDVV